MLRRANPPSVAPPIGSYTHITTVPAGSELVFVSGQVGVHRDGRPVDPEAKGQALQAFDNLGAIIADLGLTPAHVAKLNTLIVGAENLAAFRAARDEVFPAWYPDGDVPAHTLAVVAGLAAPELLVEIEAILAQPGGDGQQ
jgi:enamine deaminase RidA (YjgF/YER057c/UK114 family)